MSAPCTQCPAVQTSAREAELTTVAEQTKFCVPRVKKTLPWTRRGARALSAETSVARVAADGRDDGT